MKKLQIFKISSIALGFILPVSFVAISLETDKIDLPTNGTDVKYSVKKNKENLIEIFSDGLDYRYLKDFLIDNKNFKDFLLIKQFADQGKSTAHSAPIIFGKYENYNYWKILKNSKIFNKRNEYTYLVNSKILAETMVNHMNELNGVVDFTKNVIHPVNAAQDGSSNSNSVGDYRAIKKRDQTINVINWAQARDKISNNGWGMSVLSANDFAYKYATNFAKISNNNKPARVLINDMITHQRYFNAPGGKLDFFDGNISKSYDALQDYWAKYFSKLKSIKDSSGMSAYDNSMIVIYGDHANHDSYNGTGKVGDVLLKEKSFLMIKYPHFSNPKLKPINLDNRTVFGADIKHIISDYFKNKGNYIDNKTPNPLNNNMFNFLENNSNFSKDKLMINTEGYVMQFNGEHQLIKLKYDNRSENENFDPSKIKEYWGWS